MIPQKSNRQVSTGGLGDSKAFGISRKDEAHIMGILRDTLYSDKILAVLREYSSNAWDAHRELGKGDVPIEVSLPTYENPRLAIRDYGPGLSPEDVFEVYTQYGASTKRDTDEAVGTLGIGSKAGFAYSDTFTVTSYHGGFKRVYVALLGDDDVGTINLLHEEPSGESGVSIEIAIAPKDITEFHHKAGELFKWFRPKPDINIRLPEVDPGTVLENGAILGNVLDRYGHKMGGVWVAMMGCVPYAIKMTDIVRDSQLADYTRSESGVLFFDIGEVDINASREELKYSERTREALVTKFDALLDEFVVGILKALDEENLSSWDKRRRLSALRRLRFRVPENDYGLEGLFGDHLKLEFPKEFRITKFDHKETISTLYVSDTTRLIIKDDSRSLKGYSLDSSSEYLVRRSSPIPFDKLRKLVDDWCVKNRIDGIPISNLSEKTWVAPVRSGRSGLRNSKYLKTRFKLTSQEFFPPLSRDWTPCNAEPQSDDVFVILEAFKVQVPYFLTRYRDLECLCEFYGKPLPTIYGYKSTEKKPVTKEMCTGIHFEDWEKKFYADFTTQDIRNDLWTLELGERNNIPSSFFGRDEDGNLVRTYPRFGSTSSGEFKRRVDLICDRLGEYHAISRLLREYMEAKDTLKLWPNNKQNALRRLLRSGKVSGLETVESRVSLIERKYPLLQISETDIWGITCGWEEWVEYLKLVDAKSETENKSEIKEISNGCAQVYAI